MTLCAKLHTALDQMRHCHTLLMRMQIATYLKKILTINEQAISLSVVRLLMSPWVDNEKETDEMNKGVTFHLLFFFFFVNSPIKLILYIKGFVSNFFLFSFQTMTFILEKGLIFLFYIGNWLTYSVTQILFLGCLKII